MGWPQYLVLFSIFFVKIPVGIYKYAAKPGLTGVERTGCTLGNIMYYMIVLWVLYMGGFFN